MKFTKLHESSTFMKDADAKYKQMKKAVSDKDDYDAIPAIEALIKVLQKQVDSLV